MNSQCMSVVLVNGESGAQFYPVAPNNTVFLMDFNSNKFWVKSTRSNGFPDPMRSFSFVEDTPKEEDSSKYATREEINEIKRMLERLMPVEVSNADK